MKKRIYWELFSTFFKIGLFTFGGGYAMIPIIEDICSEKKHWITHEDMMNVTIVAESTSSRSPWWPTPSGASRSPWDCSSSTPPSAW